VDPAAVIALALGVGLNALANILMKVSALRLEERHRSEEGLGLAAQYVEPVFLVGLAAFALALYAYRRALQSFPLSVAYPVMASAGYLLVLCASVAFLHETLNLWQSVGIALIVAGVWLVSQAGSTAA
jgi:multidrug transporter EmrE-like cation transporter